MLCLPRCPTARHDVSCALDHIEPQCKPRRPTTSTIQYQTVLGNERARYRAVHKHSCDRARDDLARGHLERGRLVIDLSSRRYNIIISSAARYNTVHCLISSPHRCSILYCTENARHRARIDAASAAQYRARSSSSAARQDTVDATPLGGAKAARGTMPGHARLCAVADDGRRGFVVEHTGASTALAVTAQRGFASMAEAAWTGSSRRLEVVGRPNIPPTRVKPREIKRKHGFFQHFDARARIVPKRIF